MADGGLTLAACAALKLLPTLLKEIRATILQIEQDDQVVLEWKNRPLAGYQYQLEELISRSNNVDNEGLQRQLTNLAGQMKQHLTDLQAFCDKEERANKKAILTRVGRAAKECFTLNRQKRMDTLKGQDQKLTDSIDQALKLMVKVQIPADQEKKAQEAEWRSIVDGPAGLEKRFTSITDPRLPSIQRIMDELEKREAAHRDSFAILMFLEDAKLAGDYQKALETFWREVQGYFKTEKWKPREKEFFSGIWLHRARLARKYGEPLDIANWYFKNKHISNAEAGRPCHYINGLFVSEYVYASGLQAAARRLRWALEQLLQQAPLPWSGSMLEVEALRGALRRVKHREAVAAVVAAAEALEEARQSAKPSSSKRAGDSTRRDQSRRGEAPEQEAEAALLKAKVEALKGCTARLCGHAAEAAALMERVQGGAQKEPRAAAWDDVLAAPDQALGEGLAGHQNKRAAAGAHELARWVGWRAEELAAAAAAVDAALAGVEAAVAARQQDVAQLLAVLAAAAGGDVRVVGPRDNSCRPGRYQVFQKHERRLLAQTPGPLREPPTSLALARKLQWLGSGMGAVRFEEGHKWPACIQTLLQRPGAR